MSANPLPPPARFVTPGNSAQTHWFAEHMQPHEPLLRAWLQARFPALRDIDDLVQETYLRVLRVWSGGRIEHPKSYLFATARNAAMDRLRRECVAPFDRINDLSGSFVLDPRHDAAAAIDDDHELELLTEAIRALPARCRAVLVLRTHHGLSHAEIAEKLGISRHTVNAHITAGVMRCREYFRTRGILRSSRHEV